MPESLQGWVPEIGDRLTVTEVVELAFDYRGNTTVVKVDGTEVEGYIFNRTRHVTEPYVQMFDLRGHGPITIPYSHIVNIKFTGRDMAAGKSWAAWLERKERGRAGVAGRHDRVSE